MTFILKVLVTSSSSEPDSLGGGLEIRAKEQWNRWIFGCPFAFDRWLLEPGILSLM
jgi:hypothetical protein